MGIYEYNYFFKEIIDLIRCHHFRKSRSAQGLVYYYLFVNNLVYSLGLRHATYNVRAEFLTGLAMSVVWFHPFWTITPLTHRKPLSVNYNAIQVDLYSQKQRVLTINTCPSRLHDLLIIGGCILSSPEFSASSPGSGTQEMFNKCTIKRHGTSRHFAAQRWLTVWHGTHSMRKLKARFQTYLKTREETVSGTETSPKIVNQEPTIVLEAK